MKKLNCTILGDVNIDYVADISHFFLSSIDNLCIQSSILSYVGGNGTFFAEAAVEAGFNSINLICSFGNDIAGEKIESHFHEKRIKLIGFPCKEETGKVIILYQPEDKRILIADRGANKKIFASRCVSDFIISSTDLFYISGYVMLNDEHNNILPSIIQRYANEEAFIVIDTVPHEIFHTYKWSQYVERCKGINGIVIELPTIIGFMNRTLGNVELDCVADFLLSSFEFCLVRLNSESDFLIADREKRRIERISYKPRVASLRFTDRVAAQIIRYYVINRNNFFATSDWINNINEKIGGI